VVFLHGVHGRGEAWQWMAGVWRKYLPDAAIIFPDGMERSRTSPGMFQWWDLRSLEGRDVGIGLQRAAPRLRRFLKQVQDALEIAPDATILGGFSQGAMLALHVGERSRPPLGGILAYSGMAANLPRDRNKVRSAPPIFLYHGTRDCIVPFSAFCDTGTQLSKLGFEVAQWAAEGVDHTIDLQGADLAGELMCRWLRSAATSDQPLVEQSLHRQQSFKTA
jgi:phospholipase/carboxylesterase